MRPCRLSSGGTFLISRIWIIPLHLPLRFLLILQQAKAKVSTKIPGPSFSKHRNKEFDTSKQMVSANHDSSNWPQVNKLLIVNYNKISTSSGHKSQAFASVSRALCERSRKYLHQQKQTNKNYERINAHYFSHTKYNIKHPNKFRISRLIFKQQ